MREQIAQANPQCGGCGFGQCRCVQEKAPEPPTHLATLKAALDELASAVANRALKQMQFRDAARSVDEANIRASEARTAFDAALATFTAAVGELSK